MKSHLLALAIVAALVLPLSAQAAKFTYHGQMMDGDQPAEGLYDIKVRAYTSSDRSKALGFATELPGVHFRNGEFSVELDLPQGPNGSTYIDVAVRANATGGAYEALGEPQLVTKGAASCPGAWALDGNVGLPAGSFLGIADAANPEPLVLRTRNVQSLRLEPSSILINGTPNTANVIAGSSANIVTAGVRGATISGGGISDPSYFFAAPNQVTDHYGTVGGGVTNSAGNFTEGDGSFATVGGGSVNTASGRQSTVGGGYANTASGHQSTVGGGLSNCAGGDFSWAGGRNAKIRPGNQTGDGDCAADSGSADGDNGTFMWADDQSVNFTSNRPNQFAIRAAGGLRWGGTGVNSTTSPAFTHSVVAGTNLCDGGSGANTRTYLNHPLLNGNPSAVIVITPNFGNQSTGVAPTRNPVALYYSDAGAGGCPTGRWVIYQTTVSAEVINNGARFNVWFVLP